MNKGERGAPVQRVPDNSKFIFNFCCENHIK